MRITFVGPVPPHRGGIAQHGGQLVEALRYSGNGNEVDVVSWKSLYPRWLFKGQRPDLQDEKQPDVWFGLRWWNPISWIVAGRRVRSADLMVLAWITPLQTPALLAILFASAKTPCVLVVHNSEPHGRTRSGFAAWWLGRVLRRCVGALTHSEAAATRVRSIANIAVEVTGHPPNVDVHPQPWRTQPPLRLMFFGFVRPYKGLGDVFDAVACLRDRSIDVRLTVAGEFWSPVDRWRSRAVDLGIDHLVDLRPGYVPDADLSALFGDHHVVVAPYRQVSQSGVVPLSFAAARPVVATSVGGLPEVVIDGENGAIAVPEDPAAFADAIVRVAADLESLGTGARRSLASWDEVATAILALGYDGGGVSIH